MPKMRIGGRGSAPDPAGGAYSAPPDPLAAIRGPTSKGRGGKERGGKEKGGQGREGGEDLAIPIHICFRRP